MVFNKTRFFISYGSVGLILSISGTLTPVLADNDSPAVEPVVEPKKKDIQPNNRVNFDNFQLAPRDFPWRFSVEYFVPAAEPDITGLPFADLQQEFPSFDPLQDQERESLDDVVVPDEVPPADLNYINPPTRADRQKVNPFTTRLPLNDLVITHLTDWEVTGSFIGGEQTSSSPNLNALFTINSEIFESLSQDRVFTVDQRGEYVQLRTVLDYRSVTTTFSTPVTIIGQQLQMTLTGDCLDPDAPPGSICSFLPGLETDRSSIDPLTQLPTRINTTSSFGEIVTPESLAAIAEPGFQQGAGDQKIGLNLYFPNSGVVSGNSQGSDPNITREEEFKNALAGSYLRVRQIVQANSEKSAIARTIRGFPIVDDQDNWWAGPGLGLASLFLPDWQPGLEASDPEAGARSTANRNLFFAASNTRLPTQSFVIYHGGRGEAPNTPAGATSVEEIPAASFNSVWFGLSPVISRQSETIDGGFQVTRPLRLVESGDGEGGTTATNLELIARINNQDFSNLSLSNPYVQIYFEFYDQEANAILQSVYQEETNYYPHLSFSGNITDSTSVFRYYAGIIASEEIKPYIGLDYTKNYGNWNYRLGGIGYLNSDRDYYSAVNGNVNYGIPLDERTQLNLTGGFQYAFQNETRVGDIVSVVPLSEMSLGAQIIDPRIRLGVTNFWGLDNLANNSRSKMLVNFNVRLMDELSVAGYVAPYDDNPSRTQYGLSLNLNLGGDYNTPQLSLAWANYQYRFGTDPLGNSLSVSDNVFTLSFRFGGPKNPFMMPPRP